MTEELTGRRIVVPETRELGQLLRMLEEQGADTVACPMIAIRDAPDPVPINAWLRRFAKGTCDDLVLMTRIVVAAVGPIVAAELDAMGVQVNVIPENAFFMKPLV